MATPTQAEYDALKKAYFQGVRIVKFDGTEVHYRSLGQMASLLSRMEKELGVSTEAGHKFVSFDKGYHDAS